MEQAWIQITCSFAPQYIRLLGIPNALSRWPIHSQSADWLFWLVNAYFSLSLSHSIRQLFAPKRHGRGQEGGGCFHSRPAGFSCSVTVFAACVVPSQIGPRGICEDWNAHRNPILDFLSEDQWWHFFVPMKDGTWRFSKPSQLCRQTSCSLSNPQLRPWRPPHLVRLPPSSPLQQASHTSEKVTF